MTHTQTCRHLAPVPRVACTRTHTHHAASKAKSTDQLKAALRTAFSGLMHASDALVEKELSQLVERLSAADPVCARVHATPALPRCLLRPPYAFVRACVRCAALRRSCV